MPHFRSGFERACLLVLTVAGISGFLSQACICQGEEFHNALSLQGFTGILNTPNATVTKVGHVYTLYSEQKENNLRSTLTREESYMFSVGMFEQLEIGGRLTETQASGGSVMFRDLSGNFKLLVPFIPRGEYIPKFAVGIQDFGGGMQHLRTKYGVVSEEIGLVRLSAGYGIGPDRMDGLFGGFEAKALDWIYLLGEYDTHETNLGLRLVSPEIMGIPVNLQVTVKTALNGQQKGPEFGFGIQFPLGADYRDSKQLKPVAASPIKDGGEVIPAFDKQPTGTAGDLAPDSRVEQDKEALRVSLSKLGNRLAGQGFQNLRLAKGRENELIVEYENGRYNTNEMDGMGVVAGITAAVSPPGFDTVRLVLKKQGIVIIQVMMPLAEVRAFNADAAGLEALQRSITVSTDWYDVTEVTYLTETVNLSWFRPILILDPGLKTFIGTEYSNFDYLLSIRPDLYLPVWKGGVVNARWDVPLAWSDGFNDEQPFAAGRHGTRMDRLTLGQAMKPAQNLMLNLGVGMIRHDSNGMLNELVWQPGEGSHRFRLQQSYAVNSETHDRNDVYLGSYRYLYSPMDLYIEGTGGRYWDRDTGFSLEVKRFFGDTAFSVYYKNVSLPTNEHVQAGGIQFSLPLTPRQDMKPTFIQVKGPNDWTYAQETEIVSHGQNKVGRSIAFSPEPAQKLSTVYFNRDRLNESYIKEHLPRMRDAYLKFGGTD